MHICIYTYTFIYILVCMYKYHTDRRDGATKVFFVFICVSPPFCGEESVLGFSDSASLVWFIIGCLSVFFSFLFLFF